MSSMPISGGGSVPGGVPLVETGSGPQTTTSTTPTELPPTNSYLSLPFARNAYATLGIDVPQTPDDVTALLGDIMMMIEQTIAETRKNREAMIGDKMRSLHSKAAAEFRGLDTQAGDIGGMIAERLDKSTSSAGLFLERLGKEAARAFETDANKRAALTVEINALTARIDGLDARVRELDANIAKATKEFFDTLGLVIGAVITGTTALLGAQSDGIQRDISRDFGVTRLFEDLAERIGGNSTTPISLEPLLLEDRAQAEEVLKRLAEVLGTEIDPALLAQLLKELSFPAGEGTSPSIVPTGSGTQKNLVDGTGVPGPIETGGPQGELQNTQNTPTGITTNNTQTTPTQGTTGTQGANRPQNLDQPQHVGQPQNVDPVPPNELPAPVRPVNIVALVTLVALTGLTINQLRDEGVRGRVISSAVGLVAGLADVVTTLAALEALESVDTKIRALENGPRLRLEV